MFIIKKFIGLLLSPGVIILILLGLGLLRLVFSNQSRRSGRVLIFLGTVCFYLFTTAPLPNALLYPLVSHYKPVPQVKDSGAIDYIVILSGDVRDLPSAPPTSQLGSFTAFRVIEGIRLFHLCADRPALIMSGGDQPCAAELMVAFAQSLGVPNDKLLAETKSLDTYGNAREVRLMVKDAPFLLVTSASHLPRAMIIFQTLGMRPIPAPADINVPENLSFYDFFPSGKYLSRMSAAIHEYLGLAYLRLFPELSGR
jgi:uncharacterized SAM-binding protein YcdF (DUF218 family)